MKKKVLAFLIASMLAAESFCVVGAEDFSDGTRQDVMQFCDDEEDVLKVENNVDSMWQFSAISVGENSSKPSEDAIQMGNDVWFTFDEFTEIATISGTGDMWDYLQDGATLDGVKNPLIDQSIDVLIISDGITHISDYLLYKEKGNLYYGHGVQNIQIGKDVKSVGKYAFHCETALKEVRFMGNVVQELGDSCFRMCRKLDSIDFLGSINRLGENCFAECTGLKTIELSNSLKEIPADCFARCESLREINIPDNILNINSGAFQNCTGLKKITFSANSKIEKIEKSVWENCIRLEEVNFPNSLKEIGDEIFYNCSRLQKVDLSNSLIKIGRGAFYGCTGLETMNLPDSLTKMGYEAFGGCSKLDNVVVPKGVKNLQNGTFSNCSSLTGVILNEGLEYIGRNAFENCIRLQRISIPQSVTKIQYGFDEEEMIYYDPLTGCDSLTNIEGYGCSVAKKFYNWFVGKSQNKVTFISRDEGIYNHNWDNGTITKEATETEEGEKTYTCRNCEDTKIENIPKLCAIRITNVRHGWSNYETLWINFFVNKKVSYYAVSVNEGAEMPIFDSKHEMQTVSNINNGGVECLIPDEKVDVYIFFADEDNNNIYIKIMPNYAQRPEKPSGTMKVGDSITATVEGDTLTLSGVGETYIFEDDFFWNINKNTIKHIIVEEGITKLGDYIFSYFQFVNSVSLPKTLKVIGIDAFYKCSALEKIIIPESVETIGYGAFSGTAITSFDYPKNIISISGTAFACTNLTEFLVPESVTEIDEQAFYNCFALTKIFIPKSVTYIGTDVFRNCRNLTIYGFKDSVAESYAKANNIKFVSADYRVVFKDNGRTKKTEYVIEGQNATPPTLEAKTDYTLSWDADYTNVTEDMVINAVWTKNDSGSGGGPTIVITPSESTKYTVTFKDRGKIVKTEKVKSGDTAEYPFISRSGYELSWDKDFSKITANITVNAIWTVIKPAKVTSLTAEAGKKTITLSWDETEYTSYYLVYRKADVEAEYTQVAKTTKVLWTDRKVEPGTPYVYKVVAVRSLDSKKYQGLDSDIVTIKTGTPQIGDSYSVGDLNYKITGVKEVNVTGLAKAADTLVIPSSITISGKVYKVTFIQEKAFYKNQDIVNVTIGNNITEIGKYAFYQCSGLEKVTFGKRVAVINTYAFTQCLNLENVTLPLSVRRIGAKAFYQCTSIKILKINSANLEYVGKKGLAVNKTVTLKLPKKFYIRYKNLIKASSIYSKTKFLKI